ncbi:hypothetical protein Q1695_006461 [Nippostrongylus brasiliensis]|nr:hypothetical protein Q1695_006461 [Nippostrongylus brasiliensis]
MPDRTWTPEDRGQSGELGHAYPQKHQLSFGDKRRISDPFKLSLSEFVEGNCFFIGAFVCWDRYETRSILLKTFEKLKYDENCPQKCI